MATGVPLGPRACPMGSVSLRKRGDAPSLGGLGDGLSRFASLFERRKEGGVGDDVEAVDMVVRMELQYVRKRPQEQNPTETLVCSSTEFLGQTQA
ncbi:hypothetical protein ColTof4_04061 [Colletotrichum tofieldiae]|nr:hypothetical protein ColTof3_13908 [Colletotrichum tofieldiae]GKT71638.1 hypothetical protein ColTof4_04061 [Colletotrichum tofieldiae]